MWIIFIITVILFIIIAFLRDKNKQAMKIKNEGGMKNKYDVLINVLLGANPLAKISHESSDSINILIQNKNYTLIYIVVQTFGTLTIQWKYDGNLFGKHQDKIIFKEYEDQVEIAEQIMSSFFDYHDKLIVLHNRTKYQI